MNARLSWRRSASQSVLVAALGAFASSAIAQEASQPPLAPTPATGSSLKAKADAAVSTSSTVAQAEVKAADGGLAGAASNKGVTVGEVVVTGTHINRPNVTSIAPIVTVTSQEIAQQGAISVGDVLNQLPQVSPDNQTVYQDSNGRQQVQLRDAGFNRTLSLMDGLRLATSEGVDVNAIPVALVDHIDVLTGGAASIYGADAVAGVINFQIKKAYQGFQLNADYSLYNHNNTDNNITAKATQEAGYYPPHGLIADGGTWNLNLAVGHRFLDDRLSVEGFAGYIHADPIRVTDRDYSSCYLTQNGVVNTTPTCLLGTTATGLGVFTPLSGANAGAAYHDAADGTANFLSGKPTYRAYQFDSLYREDTRYNAGLFLNATLLPHVTAFANYLMSYDTSYDAYSPARLYDAADYGVAPYTIGCNSPLLSAQQQGVLCGAAAGTNVSVPLKIRYEFDSLGPGKEQYDNLNQRVAAGLRGDLLEKAVSWNLNAVFSRARNQIDGLATDGYPDTANLENALNGCVGVSGCTPLNIFTANGGSQKALDYIFGTTKGQDIQTGTLYDYTANVSVDLGHFGLRSPFAHDGVQTAFGGEFRVDREVNTVDEAFLNQEGYGGDFNLSQNVKEGYFEASIPLIQDQLLTHELNLTGSHRWSKYSISPDIFTTWEVGGSYAPVRDITFRSSYNKAARQPTVYELGQLNLQYSNGGGLGSDPCAGTNPTASLAVCQATGVTAAQYGHITQCDDSGCLTRTGGAQLTPETAHTLTFGAVMKPRWVPGLILSADRYDIRVDNSIGFAYASDWFNGCESYVLPYYCGHVVRNADGSLTSVDQYQKGSSPATGFVTYGNQNDYRFYVKGYDFQGQYTVPAPAIRGVVDFIYNGSVQQMRGGKDDPVSPVHNGAGYFGPNVNFPVPTYKHGFRTTYTTTDRFFSASLNWRYVGGTLISNDSGLTSLGGAPGTFPITSYNRIPAFNYFDLNTTFRIHDHYILTVLANNIMDKTPPIFPDSYNYFLSRANVPAANYDVLGRFVQVRLSVNY